MKLLIVELLRAWKAAGADQPIFLPGDLLRSPPPPLATRKEFHVYYSASNAGAAEVAESIGEASGATLKDRCGCEPRLFTPPSVSRRATGGCAARTTPRRLSHPGAEIQTRLVEIRSRCPTGFNRY